MGERYWSFKRYYADLEVPESATQGDVKKAFRRLALKWHPDKNTGNEAEATEKFKAIAEAFEVLGSTYNRRRYDDHIRTHGHQQQPSSNPTGSNDNSGGNHQASDAHTASSDPFHDDFHAEMQRAHSHFTFDQAEKIFRDFFGDDVPFSSDHSTFASSSPGQGQSAKSSRTYNKAGGASASTSVASVSPIVSTSTATSHSSDNLGRVINIKITRITRADGTVEEQKELSFDDSVAASVPLDHHAAHEAALLQHHQSAANAVPHLSSTTSSSSSTSGSPPAVAAISQGIRVELHGLTTTTLNGSVGMCGALNLNGRWTVTLADGRQIALKPDNIRPSNAAEKLRIY